MSQFVVAGSCFRDKECLVAALMKAGGWTREQIELHEEPTNLYGYKGDRRTDVANIIIRRGHIGHASNDIGFRLNSAGTYDVIISEFDRHRFHDRWVTHLTNTYNEERVIKECQMMGYSYQVEEKNGERQLVAYVVG